MKIECPECSKTIHIRPQQSRAAESMWAKLTKKERSERMKQVRRKGIERKESK